MTRTRPFEAGSWPLILSDDFFDATPAAPDDTLAGTLYERRLAWLARTGAPLLTQDELAEVREMIEALDLIPPHTDETR